MKTLRDVAQRAGVSSTTASLVLNGRQPANGPISMETQQRVLVAAKELGYRRNALVQAVMSGHNRTLGFLAAGIEGNEFISRILGGALDEAGAAGYAVHLLRLQTTALDRQVIELCLEMRLTGILAMDMNQESLDYLYAEMKSFRVPIAFIDTSFGRNWGIHVVSDDRQGCRLAVEHLTQLGHRRIAFIGGRLGRGMALVREEAYRLALQEQGLEIPNGYVRHGNWSVDDAQQAALELLRLPERPTAIFCASDPMAMGVQRAARSVGLQMPRDLSVVGYANGSVAGMADPPLTTIAQPMEEMGHVATRLIIEKLRGDDAGIDLYDEPQEATLATHLVLRSSTSTPP